MDHNEEMFNAAVNYSRANAFGAIVAIGFIAAIAMVWWAIGSWMS